MSNAVSAIDVYEAIKDKLGEDETRKLIDYVDTRVREDVATKVDLEEAKGELRVQIERLGGGLRAEIQRVGGGLRAEIQRVEGELRAEIQGVEGGLRAEIQGGKADTVKWMFLFWAGQTGVILGILKLVKAF